METRLTVTRRSVTAAKLPGVNLDNWDNVTAALHEERPLELGQAWRAAPQAGFLPARVRVGWTADGLVVWAELNDADIFNPVTTFNEAAFRFGDAFELFLRPRGQETYFEFHISPANQLFQLRIPGTGFFALQRASGHVDLERLKMPQPVVASRTRIDAPARRWSVLALVPFRAVIESQLPPPAGPWLFSFSRYDYTRGRVKPIVSSTSPHVRPDFHRQQEWGELRFGD